MRKTGRFCIYNSMFSLITERGRYIKIRSKVSREELTARFSQPVAGEIFCGRIIELSPPARFTYAAAGETYLKIARREGVDYEKLKRLNPAGEPYPTQRVWLP